MAAMLIGGSLGLAWVLFIWFVVFPYFERAMTDEEREEFHRGGGL